MLVSMQKIAVLFPSRQAQFHTCCKAQPFLGGGCSGPNVNARNLISHRQYRAKNEIFRFQEFLQERPDGNMESDFAAESELLIGEHGVICP